MKELVINFNGCNGKISYLNQKRQLSKYLNNKIYWQYKGRNELFIRTILFLSHNYF